jgi:hypothetical protein
MKKIIYAIMLVVTAVFNHLMHNSIRQQNQFKQQQTTHLNNRKSLTYKTKMAMDGR